MSTYSEETIIQEFKKEITGFVFGKEEDITFLTNYLVSKAKKAFGVDDKSIIISNPNWPTRPGHFICNSLEIIDSRPLIKIYIDNDVEEDKRANQTKAMDDFAKARLPKVFTCPGAVENPRYAADFIGTALLGHPSRLVKDILTNDREAGLQTAHKLGFVMPQFGPGA